MKNTKEYYDKTAKEMADKWYEDEYLLPYLKEFIEYLPEFKQALTPLSGAVNLKKNHYGEFYMAWLQTYNPYTRELID